MLWTDLELDRDLPEDHLRRAWSTVFDVAPNAIAIIDDIAEANPWADPQVRIVLERRRQPGDFPLHVMVILGDPELDALVKGEDKELAMIRRLCVALECRALVSTTGIEPWEWLIVSPDGQMTVVELDDDALDETGAVIVLRETAMTLR